MNATIILVRDPVLTTNTPVTDQLSTQELTLETHTKPMPGPTQSMVPHGDTEEISRPWVATDMVTVKATDTSAMVTEEDQAGDTSHATTEQGQQ